MVRRRVRKTVRFFDGIVDRAFLLLSLLIFLIGMYSLYDSYLVYQQAGGSDIFKFKPGYEGEGAPEKEIVGNMVSWLTVDDTNIDYPVMQGEDNMEYLNTDPFGEYSLAGSIFLDNRNSPDFSD